MNSGLFLILSVFLIFSGYFYQNKALTLHFADEEYNFVLGNQLLEGRKLYSQIFLNHQPVAPILSAGIQKVTKPNSIFLLVKRHREVMIAYSIVWLILLYLKFGVPVLAFTAIFELTKIYLLGNLFLAESIAIYPLIYLSLILYQKIKTLSKLESVFIGACIAFIFFLILPLWPLIFGIFLFLIIQKKITTKNILYLLIGAFPFIILFFLTSPLKPYFEQTIIFNYRYVPFDSGEHASTRFFKAFVTPLISLFSNVDSPSGRIIQLLSLILSANVIWLILQKKYFITLVIFVLLGLANLRFISPGEEYYRGFHLLPWFALLVLFGILTTIENFKKPTSAYLKVVLVCLLAGTILLSFIYGKTSLFVKNDLQKDLDINYSQQFTIGEAVRIMKSNNDNLNESLFVIPDEWLIYWQSGFNLPDKINTYYVWMNQIPSLRRELESMFLNDAPTYLFCNCSGNLNIDSYLENYGELTKNGGHSQLFVLPSKLKLLNKDQKLKLREYGFEI